MRLGGMLLVLVSFLLLGCEEESPPIGQCEFPQYGPAATQSVKVGVLNNFRKYNDKVIIELNSRNSEKKKEVVVVVNEVCKETQLGGSEVLSVIKKKSKNASFGSLYKSYLVKFSEPKSLDQIRNDVNSDECIEGVSDHLILKHTSFSDPLINQQKHLGAVYAQDAWNSVFDIGASVLESSVIAVIDSGVDLSHEDLRDRLWVNVLESRGAPGVDDDGNGYIDDIHGYNFVSNSGDPSPVGSWNGVAHGTHVAGLAAAAGDNGRGGSGVAPRNVQVMALNVFGNSSGASTVNIDNAIRYAADNGADVINLSLGGPGRSESTGAAIAYAISRGVTVVAAAGNSSLDIDRYFYTPASYGGQYSGMVTVGASVASRQGVCYFSNYGTYGVEISAPGCDQDRFTQDVSGVVSTVPGGYDQMAGTSMSSPIVAGAAALASLVKAGANGGEKPSPGVVETLLRNSATSIGGFQNKFNNGAHLQVENLVLQADSVSDPSVPDPSDPGSPGGPPPDSCI